ncbi:MAG: CotH kinase family protein [Bacteroidetes bacterium]|nr:CotH kinase family protein [Bacteroidota bacterium]
MQPYKKHVPVAKTNFVKLYLNGANWGLYPNIQQLNKDYLEQWYLSNDGIWWRATDLPAVVVAGEMVPPR